MPLYTINIPLNKILKPLRVCQPLSHPPQESLRGLGNYSIPNMPPAALTLIQNTPLTTIPPYCTYCPPHRTTQALFDLGDELGDAGYLDEALASSSLIDEPESSDLLMAPAAPPRMQAPGSSQVTCSQPLQCASGRPISRQSSLLSMDLETVQREWQSQCERTHGGATSVFTAPMAVSRTALVDAFVAMGVHPTSGTLNFEGSAERCGDVVSNENGSGRQSPRESSQSGCSDESIATAADLTAASAPIVPMRRPTKQPTSRRSPMTAAASAASRKLDIGALARALAARVVSRAAPRAGPCRADRSRRFVAKRRAWRARGCPMASKKLRYGVRQGLALTRARVGGRFVKRSELSLQDEETQTVAAPVLVAAE